MADKITLQLGAQPSKEEIMTANFLISTGRKTKIRFLAPSHIKGIKTPDIEMDGQKWEVKCPVGKGSNTIKRAFQVAIAQSPNIIFDLRHSKMPDAVNISRLEKEFHDIKKAKKMKIITKSRKLLAFTK